MKKKTMKLIMGFVIILIFGLSSIAFVATSLVQPQQTKFRQLDSVIVAGEIDKIYESTYVQNGFTWIKFYNLTATQEFVSFVESLPYTFTVPGGQPQIILQKINSAQNDVYIVISSLAGQEIISKQSEDEVVSALCRLLTVPPIECVLKGIENSSSIRSPNTTQ